MKFLYKRHKHPIASTETVRTVGVAASCAGCTYFYVRIQYNALIYIYIYIYTQGGARKPARRLLDQRGRRSRTLYRNLNKCKCKVLTG